MDRRRGPRFHQGEDLHPGHRALPGPEGAARPQRQGDGALLRRGSVCPQWGGKKRRENRHLEGGIAKGGQASGNGQSFGWEGGEESLESLHEVTPNVIRNTRSTNHVLAGKWRTAEDIKLVRALHPLLTQSASIYWSFSFLFFFFTFYSIYIHYLMLRPILYDVLR